MTNHRKATILVVSRSRQDGAAWAVEVRPETSHVRRGRGRLKGGTPHQACLQAASEVFEGISSGAALELVCDIDYLTRGIRDYLPSWIANGWRKGSGGKVSNVELWERLADAMERHDVAARRSQSGEERAAMNALKASLADSPSA